MDVSSLTSLLGHTNASEFDGKPAGSLLVDDFEIVPGFSGEVVIVHLIHDPDGWKQPAVELPSVSGLLTYTIRERFPDGAADEPVVLMGERSRCVPASG